MENISTRRIKKKGRNMLLVMFKAGGITCRVEMDNVPKLEEYNILNIKETMDEARKKIQRDVTPQIQQETVPSSGASVRSPHVNFPFMASVSSGDPVKREEPVPAHLERYSDAGAGRLDVNKPAKIEVEKVRKILRKECIVCKRMRAAKHYKAKVFERKSGLICKECTLDDKVCVMREPKRTPKTPPKLVKCLGYCGEDFMSRGNRRICPACKIRQKTLL